MGKHSNLSLILVATSSFISGIGIGIFIASSRGIRARRWVTDHAADLSKWLDDKKNITLQKSSNQLHKIQDRMEKSYRDSIPDLYEATENIDFDSSH